MGFWRKKGLVNRLLLPAAAAYAVVVAARRQLYKNGILKTREKHPPVLVVGNIVTGGAGKTPLVIALLLALKKRGLKPGPLRAVSAVILTAYGKSIPMMIGGVVAMKHCLSNA